MTSGNTERVKDAQARIRAAIIGVIIVASSVLVLRIINPDLVSLRQPSVESIFNRTFNFIGKSCVGNEAIMCGIQAGNQTFCHPGTGRCTFKVTVGQNCESPEWCISGNCDTTVGSATENKCVRSVVTGLTAGSNCVEGLNQCDPPLTCKSAGTISVPRCSE